MAVKILNLDLVIISLVTSVICQNSDHLHTLQCNSLPSFDNTDFYIYFGCSCDSSQTPGGTFSISRFAYNLTQRISDKSLVIDFRDCRSLNILLDQELLYWKLSPVFRPGLSIVEINVDNVKQLNLSHGSLETSQNVEDYVLPNILEKMSVHLYDVGTVRVQADVPMDLLTTEQDITQLHINTTGTRDGGYHFSLQGFIQQNIFFIADDTHSHTNLRQMNKFENVFEEQHLLSWIMIESKTMSIWLCVSVFIVTIGMGTMIIAIVKRHRLAIENVIYGSIGSLKRLKRKGSTPPQKKEDTKEKTDSNNNSDLTTATEVAFFPRYSVVNKSWRDDKTKKQNKETGKDVKSKEEKKGADKNIHKTTVSKSHKANTNKSSKDGNNQNSSKQSLYEIISTMKFKTQQVNTESTIIPKKEGHQTSFYFQGENQSTGSSKYDLTLARTLSKKVEVQVHQPDYVSNKKSVIDVEQEEEDAKSSSPAPLIGNQSDNIYSFNTLREKCRQLIANSKPFQPNKTKL